MPSQRWISIPIPLSLRSLNIATTAERKECTSVDLLLKPVSDVISIFKYLTNCDNMILLRRIKIHKKNTVSDYGVSGCNDMFWQR